MNVLQLGSANRLGAAPRSPPSCVPAPVADSTAPRWLPTATTPAPTPTSGWRCRRAALARRAHPGPGGPGAG